MTGDEHEPQEIVAHVIVEFCFEIRHGHLLGLALAAELLVLAGKQYVSAEEIDCTVLGRGHQPGSRILRSSRLGPLLESCDQGVLREIFGHSDVAHHSYKRADELRRLNAPDRIDCSM